MSAVARRSGSRLTTLNAMTGDLGELIERQLGVMSMRQATRFLSRGTVRNQLRTGRWQRAHRGVVVTHNGGLTEDQRLWVASLAVGNGWPAPLGGLTALRAHGLTGFTPPTITVLLPAGQQRRDPPPGVTVVRTTTCFQQRFVRLDDVLDVIERLPRVRRRQLTLTTARDAAAGATSLSELDFLAAIRAAGLPEPTLQHRRRDAEGRWRSLDAYFAEYGVHVEVDGAQHRDPVQAWADMARQNALWLPGERVMRFPAWLVRDHPEIVVAQVRQALVAAGWPG
jgi:very-short-patch-repair endonuclease